MSPGGLALSAPTYAHWVRRLPVLLAMALVAGCGGEDGSKQAAPIEPPRSHAPTTGSPPSTVTAAASPSNSTSSAPPATVPPTAARPVALADVRVRLTPVATLEQPLAMAQRSGDDAFYVAGKRGRVRAVRGGQVGAEPVLDLSGEVSTGSEQGLLGIAFSPDGGLLYASFTDRAGDSRLWEFAFRDGKADRATQRELLFQDQPFANHNGGQITFGPDGMLYVFFGDGGSANDPMNNGQRLDTWLGKILRINPQPSGSEPYAVPSDNPFVGRAGARAEIWAYGLRNPWRSSWDRMTGDQWIGDVGQNALEEIDFCPKDAARGANFGWAAFEGTRRNSTYVLPPPAEPVPPVYEYELTGGNCAVTGGYVYRGTRVPGLQGAYLFADFCVGEIMALRYEGGRVVERASLGLQTDQLASFGEDRDGELYVLSLAGGFFRIDAG